jgi:hypothetical protein
MRFSFHNDSAPEPMPPSHAKRQPQATTTSDTAINPQRLTLSVKVPASKAFDNAEATIKTVKHPLNQRVGFLLVQVPKPDFRSPPTPLSPDWLKVLGVNPT